MVPFWGQGVKYGHVSECTMTEPEVAAVVDTMRKFLSKCVPSEKTRFDEHVSRILASTNISELLEESVAELLAQPITQQQHAVCTSAAARFEPGTRQWLLEDASTNVIDVTENSRLYWLEAKHGAGKRT